MLAGDVEVLDVTIPLRFNVNDSMLQMLGANKRDQIGFMNPLLDSHEQPYLYVQFQYRDVIQDVLIPENTPLQLPMIAG